MAANVCVGCGTWNGPRDTTCQECDSEFPEYKEVKLSIYELPNGQASVWLGDRILDRFMSVAWAMKYADRHMKSFSVYYLTTSNPF